MTSVEKTREALLAALRDEKHVGLDRASRRGQTIDGFVVGAGRKWALLAATMTGGFFDGYVALRLTDIARVRANPSWEDRFARTRPEWPPRPPAHRPAIDLDTTSGMLATFLDPDTLVGIERDKKYDAMWVGVPNALTRHWFALWEVDSDAVWHDGPLGYRPRTITLVRTGDHYLRGLAVVAGPPPRSDVQCDWSARSKYAGRLPR